MLYILSPSLPFLGPLASYGLFCIVCRNGVGQALGDGNKNIINVHFIREKCSTFFVFEQFAPSLLPEIKKYTLDFAL